MAKELRLLSLFLLSLLFFKNQDFSKSYIYKNNYTFNAFEQINEINK